MADKMADIALVVPAQGIVVARDPLGEFNIVLFFHLIRSGFCFTLWRYAIGLKSHGVKIKTSEKLSKPRRQRQRERR